MISGDGTFETGELSAQQAERMAFIHDLKRFAIERLGVRENRSFETYKDTPSFYALYIASHDALETAHNLGWTHETWHEREPWIERQQELEGSGYDLLPMVWDAAGDNKCPVSPGMLSAPKEAVSRVVFHEQVHINMMEISPRRIALPLEEAAAEAFVYQGMMRYFHNDKDMQEEINRVQKDWTTFLSYGIKYIALLDKAYAKSTKQGRALLHQAREEAEEMHAHTYSETVKKRLQMPINNAFFYRLKQYAPHHQAAFEILEQYEPAQYMPRLRRLIGFLSEPSDLERFLLPLKESAPSNTGEIHSVAA